jgi:F-type H+-transporting ATPase subunit delta
LPGCSAAPLSAGRNSVHQGTLSRGAFRQYQGQPAGRYASALFELASEAGNVTAVESDLEKLAAALAESAELRALIRNPEVSREALGRVLAGLGEPLKLDG